MAVLSDEQFETLTRALGDAADYRNDGGEECVDCDELEEHTNIVSAVETYKQIGGDY